MFNKLQQVWRKKRVKQVMQQELVNKGATAQVAQSYVMSLENDDLQRYQDEKADSDLGKRFTRQSQSGALFRSRDVNKMRPATSAAAEPKRKTAAYRFNKQKHDEQEERLISKLETLMHKMDDFELRAEAYKLSQLELTKKAVTFQQERNKRMRERNNVVITNN